MKEKILTLMREIASEIGAELRGPIADDTFLIENSVDRLVLHQAWHESRLFY